MSYLDNLKLGTKALIPTLFISALFIGVAGYGAERLSTISNTTASIVKGSDPAILFMARATRASMEIAFDVYRIMGVDSDTPGAVEAHNDFLKLEARGDDLFDKAIGFAPARADHIRAFKTRFDNLVKQAQSPIQIGLDTPGLDRGSGLKPQELDLIAVGAKEMIPIQEGIVSLMKDILADNLQHEA